MKTRCCNTYSTYMDACDGTGEWVLCCKACHREVWDDEGIVVPGGEA